MADMEKKSKIMRGSGKTEEIGICFYLQNGFDDDNVMVEITNWKLDNKGEYEKCIGNVIMRMDDFLEFSRKIKNELMELKEFNRCFV